MLNLSKENVIKGIINHKYYVAQTEQVNSPLNLEQVYYARDALAKDIYERTFNWIIKKINQSLEVILSLINFFKTSSLSI